MKTLLILAFLLATIAGCSSSGQMSEISSARSTPEAAKPTLDVKVETNGHDAKVIIATNLRISKEHYGGEKVNGEGHIHMYLDDGEKMIVTDKEYLLTNLSAGKHTVKVSLHNNDHTPYDVTESVNFVIP